jgi:A/G-specific adenine glycosylase
MAKSAGKPVPGAKSVLQNASGSLAELQVALLAWYARNQRALPWRKDRDAYRVWVSEIMLQQTRVAAVLEHYRRFLTAFPTVEALAHAPEEQVLALWSGLGYYRRARMLHRAAQVVVRELDGVIPRELEGLRKLPGVGRYTAAAIASIAHGEPAAVVDGNVERVLSRMDGQPHSDAMAWQRAQELLDPGHPGDWNQAMMELGATVCTPQNPQCLVCPVRSWCRAPGAETSKPGVARKQARITRALIVRGARVYLVQRPATAAKMAAMWELPEIAAADGQLQLCVVRHSITDTDYEVRVVSLTRKALDAGGKESGRWADYAALGELPLTGLTRKILRRQGLL